MAAAATKTEIVMCAGAPGGVTVVRRLQVARILKWSNSLRSTSAGYRPAVCAGGQAWQITSGAAT